MISIEHIDQLIPEYFQESEHFYLVFLDVEGNVKDSNSLFDHLIKDSKSTSIFELLEVSSRKELESLIDKLMLKPKEQFPILLQFDFIKNKQSWWEFSMVINSEMDPLGFIGIGVDLGFLDKKLPWDNLIDLLNYGKAELDSDLNFISAEPIVGEWILDSNSNLLDKNLLQSDILEFNSISKKDLEKLIENEGVVQFSVLTKNTSPYRSFSINLIKHSKGFLLFMRPSPQKGCSESDSLPFTNEQIDLISCPVWILGKNFCVAQQNNLAQSLTKQWAKISSDHSSKFNSGFAGDKSQRLIEIISQAFDGVEKKLAVKIKNRMGTFEYWTFHVKGIPAEGKKEWVIIQGIDQSVLYNRLSHQEKDLQTLREIALRPSHILRSPLSSMLGLLDLIDYRSLDPENQKYISYLKPLAQELDDVIRNNAKKMAQLD